MLLPMSHTIASLLLAGLRPVTDRSASPLGFELWSAPVGVLAAWL